jgi:hypothetical protein
MVKRFVEYREVRMIEGWPERIRQAQFEVDLSLAGRSVARSPYGDEQDDWGAKNTLVWTAGS